jgi:hypothetical protein
MLILKKGGTSMRSFACPCAHHKDIRGPGCTPQFHLFLTSTLDGPEWSALRPGRFTTGEEPQYPPSKRLKPTCLNIQAPRRHERNLVRVKCPSNIFHTWEDFFWPRTWRHIKNAVRMGKGGLCILRAGSNQSSSSFWSDYFVNWSS